MAAGTASLCSARAAYLLPALSYAVPHASQRWRCYASCFDSAALWLARREWFFSSLPRAPHSSSLPHSRRDCNDDPNRMTDVPLKRCLLI